MSIRACVLVFAVVAVATPAGAETAKSEVETPALGEDAKLYNCEKSKASVMITLKPETEIKDLLIWVMSFTCKTFVLDPRITMTGKRVTIMTPSALTPAQSYRVFLAALATIGLTIVPKGEVYRVVEAATAKGETVPIAKTLPESSEQIVRYVYRPAHAQGETVKQAFTALKSSAGEIQSFGALLLITDYASHLRDMMSLAKLIDVPGGTDGVYTIPVRHADATKLAQKLESFLGVTASSAAPSAAPRSRDGAPGPAPIPEAAAVPSKIMVDERTNTLVLASSEAGYLRLKALVERLDIALETEAGASFHIYRLTSAVAEEMAATLTQALGGAAPQQQRAPAGAQNRPGAPPTPATPAPQPAPAAAAAAAGQLGSSLDGPVRVIADKPSNSLIVLASGRDFLALRGILRELDQPRRQVYIEALILEVAVDNSRDLSTSWHGASPFGSEDKNGARNSVIGMQPGSVSTLDPTSIAGATAPIFGLLGKATTFFGTSIPSWGVLLQAVATSSHTNIMSAPSMIAVDNQTTTYKVGVNIPYPSASFTGLGGGDIPGDSQQTTFNRQDLLLEFTITPHISVDDQLFLAVKYNAKDQQGELKGQPVWSTREIETRLSTRNGQTNVIGGLLQEREVSTDRKVPILGDIPILGYLFKSTAKTKAKTNLVILLTPHIVRDQLEAAAIRDRKVREYDEFVRSSKSLSAMRYLPELDYRKKRGLVEEINATVLEIDAAVAARAALRSPPGVTPGVVETPARSPD